MQFSHAHDAKIAAMFMAMFTATELRQFIHEWVGGSIARQLPGEIVSLDVLARGAVAVLRRNNLLDRHLFDELLRVRPHQQSTMAELAEQCSSGALAVVAPDATALALPSHRTPDYVIQQTYESLRAQRDLVRVLVHHFSPAQFVLSVDNASAERGPLNAVRAWMDAHAAQIAYPPVRQALQALGLAYAGLSARDEGIQMFSAIIITFLVSDPIKSHLRTVQQFAQLTEVQLYDLVLQEVGHEQRALR